MSALRGKADNRWSGFNQGRRCSLDARYEFGTFPPLARQRDCAALDQNEALRYE
jgi:hypothetical protein